MNISNILDVPQPVNADEWQQFGERLCQADSHMQWLWGDWWVAGEDRYSNRTAIVDCPDWQGPSRKTLMNYGVVCRRFPPQQRPHVGTLSFSHHKVCAGAKIEHRSILMDKAEAEGWTVVHLENAMRSIAGKAPKEAPRVTTSYTQEPEPEPEPQQDTHEPVTIEAKPQPSAKPRDPVAAATEFALAKMAEANNALATDGVMDRLAMDMDALRKIKRQALLREVCALADAVK